MSVRRERFCDFVKVDKEKPPERCVERAVRKCPLCRKDYCEKHGGGYGASLQVPYRWSVKGETTSPSYHSFDHFLRPCQACADKKYVIPAGTAKEINRLLDKAVKVLLEGLRPKVARAGRGSREGREAPAPEATLEPLPVPAPLATTR